MVFLDTNVIIDALGERAPHDVFAQKVFTLSDAGQFDLAISTLSIVTTEYILKKNFTKSDMLERLSLLMSMAQQVALTSEIVNLALSSKFNDFKDAVQFYSAMEVDAKVILTRDLKDFKQSSILVQTPELFLKTL